MGSGSSKLAEWGGEEVLLLEPAMGLGPGDGSGVWDTRQQEPGSTPKMGIKDGFGQWGGQGAGCCGVYELEGRLSNQGVCELEWRAVGSEQGVSWEAAFCSMTLTSSFTSLSDSTPPNILKGRHFWGGVVEVQSSLQLWIGVAGAAGCRV